MGRGETGLMAANFLLKEKMVLRIVKAWEQITALGGSGIQQ